jgi:hypothetical protein
MPFDVEFITKMLVGNLEYLLLIISMMMTRMLMLRILAISSGAVGGAYSFFWLLDPVGTFWEVTFTLVNVVQIALVTYRNRIARFTDDERAFYSQLVPELEPQQVRRLLRCGSWIDAEAGTRLTRQGELVSHLTFLKSGRAHALVDDTPIGVCNAGSLIGEISIRSGEPATATVVATESVRYLILGRKELHKIMQADSEIERAIDRVCQRSLEYKLVRMNKAALRDSLRAPSAVNRPGVPLRSLAQVGRI